MVIIYGTRTVFKREGPVGTSVCPNCRHNVMHTLCRQLNQATLFYIPIFSHQKQRGIMCESCGMITPVSAQEYRLQRCIIKQYLIDITSALADIWQHKTATYTGNTHI